MRHLYEISNWKNKFHDCNSHKQAYFSKKKTEINHRKKCISSKCDFWRSTLSDLSSDCKSPKETPLNFLFFKIFRINSTHNSLKSKSVCFHALFLIIPNQKSLLVLAHWPTQRREFLLIVQLGLLIIPCSRRSRRSLVHFPFRFFRGGPASTNGNVRSGWTSGQGRWSSGG